MMLSGRKNGSKARLVIGAILALAAAVGPAIPAGSESRAGPRTTYIVELDRPKRAPGQFTALLDRAERRVLSSARAGKAPVVHRYRRAFSGFAARLTPAQAEQLARTAGVAAVTRDTVYHPLAERPARQADGVQDLEPAAFLGLPDGIWARAGGAAGAGDGVVIGVLDTGIDPDHPSFADRPDGPGGERRYDGPAYAPLKDWKGACETGHEFPATACNNKLIGARSFFDGFKASRLKMESGEFLSPRDSNGHGSHVAAIAAGNYGVKPELGGTNLGIAGVSGIAPRARIAAYKICWTAKLSNGDTVDGYCMGSDAVAAIDAAVADGVDVINYSVGTSASMVFGPVERAFLGAAAAGVFVANAAGNEGPEAGTIGSPTGVPWVTSVAATTLGRTFESSFVVSPRRPESTAAGAPDAVTGRGASLAGGLTSAPLIEASRAAAPGVDPARAALCLPDSLSADAVAGKAVLCTRGRNARVEKSRVVHDAGGVGLVLANTKAGEPVAADVHWVPAVHVSAADGAAIEALLEDGGAATLSLGGGHPVAAPADRDRVAAFSSRGPDRAVPDIVKPDVAAPGVNILAADTPKRATGDQPGESFQIRSGTSMASPEVAGAAALLKQLEPEWSPAAIKSALMTSAEWAVLSEDGRRLAGPLDIGSGRIDPNRAASPGLVLDLSLTDYLRFLKGVVPDAVAEMDLEPLAPVDLNLPAVAFSALSESASTVRRFTSVDRFRQSWTVEFEAPPGITGSVGPDRFDILPGATQAVSLTLTVAGAAAGTYTSGAIVLTNTTDGRRVRLPVSVLPG